MRIAAFSDWRVQSFDPLISWLRKLRPDIILYGGDDTVRLGKISESALQKIAQDFEGGEKTITPSRQESIIIEANTTLSKFKKKHEHLEQGSIFDRLGIVTMKPRPKGQWIGPPPRRRGTCIYYKHKGESWLDEIASLSTHGLGAVVGNDCDWVDRYRLSGENISNLHEEPLILGDVAILGLEGSPLDIGFILYKEDDAREHLEFQYEQTKGAKKRILVTHAPPKGVLDLSRRFDIHHIGSQAVREFIEERDIDLVVCGHSHINGGRYEKVGDCYVLNIASHDYYGAPGRVALVNLGKKGSCEIATDVLYDSDSALFSLHKLGEKRLQSLASLGIDSLEKIVEKNRKKMQTLHGVGDHLITKWILEAKLLMELRAVRITDQLWNEIDLQKCFVYDIETDTFQQRVWSIGVYTSDDSEYTQFFEKDDEKKLLEDFFEFAENHKHLRPYTFSSTDFDLRVVRSIAKMHDLNLPEVLTNGIDVGWLSVHRTLGTPKGGLKAIAPFFGYEWSDSEMDGVQAGMLYSKYLRSGEEPNWDNLLQYNRDDVMATFWLLEKLLELEEISL